MEIDFDELPSRIFNGMISVQVPTSLCMQNKLIMHSRYCFVEEYVHQRKSNIYMADLNLGMNKNGSHFPLPLAFSLSLSLLCPPLTRLLLFRPAFLYLSLRPVLFFRSRSAFSGITCTMIRHSQLPLNADPL